MKKTTKKKVPRKPPARRLSVYNAMEIALRKEGFVRPGALGSYLIDKFLSNNHYIFAADALENGFYKEKKNAFSDWRQCLIDGEWIIHDNEENAANNTKGKCRPGKRLNGYLNKEKIKHEEIVTTRMLETALSAKVSLEDFEAFKVEFTTMMSGLTTWMGSYLKQNPPDTPARRVILVRNIKKGIVGFTEADIDKEERNHPDYRSFIKN
jgi:hypothetical protein